MKIERFEELDCWKAARELVKMTYLCRGLIRYLKKRT